MKSNVKKFRALFILLVFVLVLAPLNVFAETSKTQVNYVSLGDSLAAGLLSDGKTINDGYAAHIKKSLESNGYQVEFTNKGVPGFTSGLVYSGLQQVKELNNADIVTISAGANDLLQEINFDKLKQLNPNYLDPDKVVESVTAINQQMQTFFIEGEQLLSQLDQSLTDLEGILNNYKTVVPDLITNFNNAKQDITKAAKKFNEAKTAFQQQNGDPNSLLKESITFFESGINKFKTIITAAKGYANFVPGLDQKLTTLSDTLNNLETKITTAKEVYAKYEEIEIAKEVSQMLDNVQQKISAVGQNIVKMIQYIKQVNPNAKIYVMGYYNALPYLSKDLQQYTVPLIQGLNNAIKTATEANGATFVPTYSVFEGKYESYLPNPSNIHPGVEGYNAIGNAFMNEIKKTYPAIPVNPEVETNITVKLNEKITVHKGQQLTIANTNTTLVLPSDLPDGTVLTVTKTDNAKLSKAKGLKAVGDVLNFHFEFPPGYENYKGKYQLIMKYGGDSSNNVDIYYFDEQSQTWIKQNGKHNKKAKELRLEVSHFSNYGVFVQETTKDASSPFKSVDKDGKPLPKTATNHYNWILAGFIMMVIGLALGLGKKNFIRARS